ncbi:TPA: hypothetical protein PIW05_005016 [Klebsiella quasipneumoniae subsp. similipneumoniae]|nr:hypothetical protein [Klebsiella quasipneumoniae subsp. similipneumoniae]HDH1871596.1 hypothetical protein [Klebsiella quasipneumoniae subsp. similipneumoniae]
MKLTDGQLLFRLQDFQGAEQEALGIGDYEFAQESADIANALRELLQARRTIEELTSVVEQRNGECVRLHSELESRTVKLPKLKMLEDYLAEVAIEERKQILVGVKLEFHRALTAAGIKVEAE